MTIFIKKKKDNTSFSKVVNTGFYENNYKLSENYLYWKYQRHRDQKNK